MFYLDIIFVHIIIILLRIIIFHKKPIIQYNTYYWYSFISFLTIVLYSISQFDGIIATLISFGFCFVWTITQELFGKVLYHRKIKHKGFKNYTTYITKSYRLSFLDGTNKLHNEKIAAVKNL